MTPLTLRRCVERCQVAKRERTRRALCTKKLANLDPAIPQTDNQHQRISLSPTDNSPPHQETEPEPPPAPTPRSPPTNKKGTFPKSPPRTPRLLPSFRQADPRKRGRYPTRTHPYRHRPSRHRNLTNRLPIQTHLNHGSLPHEIQTIPSL